MLGGSSEEVGGMAVLVGYVRKGKRGEDDYVFKLSDGRIGLLDKAIKDAKLNVDEVWVLSEIVSKPSYAIVRPVTKLQYKHIYPVNEVGVDIVREEEDGIVVRIADREFKVKK